MPLKGASGGCRLLSIAIAKLDAMVASSSRGNSLPEDDVGAGRWVVEVGGRAGRIPKLGLNDGRVSRRVRRVLAGMVSKEVVK